MSGLIQKLDDSFQNTRLGTYFELEARGSKLSIEFGGAVATFMTTAYILAVNPRILADSGGPCVPDPEEMGGIFGPEYSACVNDLMLEYITSTALCSMLGCFLMGGWANLPLILAPGMGMNAYFTYGVVGFRGTGNVAFESAVTAVLIEGAIFLVLALTGLRYWVAKLIPEPVRAATPAAIGAFLAHLGLQTANGIGLVVGDIATSVTIGGCPLDKRTPLVALTPACAENSAFCVTSDAYTCDDLGGIMASGTVWLGIGGLMIILFLMAFKKRYAFIAGIGVVTVISWFRNTAVTYFPDTPDGDARFEYFKQVVRVEGLDMLVTPFSSDLASVALPLLTFFYVDFLGTAGTMIAFVDVMGFKDELPKSRAAFSVDAIATMFGALFGLSPVTAYIESGAGIAAGARTGLTAIFCGFFFLLSIFFAPIIASIPPWASGGALVVVGCIMAGSLNKVKWHDPTHAATAFLTVIIMPLTYSIAYGLLGGLMCWLILQIAFKLLSLAGIERPEFEPESISDDAQIDETTKKAQIDDTAKASSDDLEVSSEIDA